MIDRLLGSPWFWFVLAGICFLNLVGDTCRHDWGWVVLDVITFGFASYYTWKYAE